MRLNLVSKYFVVADEGKIGWAMPELAFSGEPS